MNDSRYKRNNAILQCDKEERVESKSKIFDKIFTHLLIIPFKY